jgi:hypothetical protein
MEEDTQENTEVVTSAQTSNLDNQFIEVELSEEELVEKKLMLDDCEISKDETDTQLAELEKRLDSRIDARFLDEDIAKLEKDISENKNKQGEDASEADIAYMNIQLETLKKHKELDIPMRKLRQNIAQLRYTKNRPDAKEQQIKKLQKEIREKKATTLKSRVNSYPKVPRMVQ